jgi:NAD(P)-dependent dehydrogenase (short-subunit alcohol dehydrogenase family)
MARLTSEPINTDMLAGESEEWKRANRADVSIDGFGEVAEVMPTAIFLASTTRAVYAGQVLDPNRGDVMLQRVSGGGRGLAGRD